MKVTFIEPTVLRVDCVNPWERIERAGRVCYAGTPKGGEEAVHFCERLAVRGHMTPFEHASIRIMSTDLAPKSYLLTSIGDIGYKYPRLGLHYNSPWVEGTVRAFMEAGFCLRSLIDRTDKIEPSPDFITLHITTDRGIANELARHRSLSYDDRGYSVEWRCANNCEPSFVQQSTRFVNYDKAGLRFVVPMSGQHDQTLWRAHCQASADAYEKILESGEKPQYARNVLPLSTATELIMSGYLRDWETFLNLRLAPDAHPEARVIAYMAYLELQNMLPADKDFADWASDVLEQVANRKG